MVPGPLVAWLPGFLNKEYRPQCWASWLFICLQALDGLPDIPVTRKLSKFQALRVLSRSSVFPPQEGKDREGSFPLGLTKQEVLIGSSPTPTPNPLLEVCGTEMILICSIVL